MRQSSFRFIRSVILPVALALLCTAPAMALVRLRDLSVTQEKRNVLISWQTSFESDNLGFNIYRQVSGQQTKINKYLIAGTALQSKKQDAEAGHVYRYSDKLDEGTFAQYWLEDVDTAGRHTMHGPVSPTAGEPYGTPNTTPLPGLGSGGVEFVSPDGFGIAHATAQEPAAAAQYKQQLDLAADSGLKIFVRQEGWYRLTRAAMAAAGFDPGSDPRAISLYMLGTEQSMIVDDGGDGKLDANDAIEFYGYPLDSVSTGARTYWLRPKKGGENRVTTSKIRGGNPITGSVPFTYERVERSVFFAALTTNGDVDNFFGELIGNWTGTEPLKVGNLDASYGGNATLDVVIQGSTDMAHRIDVAINGHSLGTVALQKTEQPAFTFQLPQSWLTPGANSVTLTSLNGDEDVSIVAKSRLTYQHLLRADNGALDVSLPGGRSVTIGGFGANTVRAFDITDPRHPTELQTAVAADPQGGFAATFSTLSGGTRTVLSFDGTRLLAPGELAANAPSSWSDTNGNSNGSKAAADFYIISNKSFIDAAATLKSLRDSQGIGTAIVDVDDLYDEFNFGIRSPEAIRSFFRLAASWKRAPSAALLLGDASMDPRNYLGVAAVDYVPTKLVPTIYMKTASDDWFTDFNGDGIADIPVGRIPVRTPAEASLVIGKITSRGTPSGAWSRSALFVADRPVDFDFPGVAASLTKLLPSSIKSQTIDFSKTSSPHSDVVNGMNNGALLVTYIGHSSVEMWSQSVFLSADASALTNGSRLPVVVAMTCLNGYFHDLYTESMAEALLKAPNGGAVAVWASSTLTEPDQQSLMSHELFRQLFRTDVNLTLGDAMGRAKIAATDPDVRKSWILFGDPTMKLRP
ncbi:MAG: C25 family cysteine peptidase [Acidobacteriota bacterium]|nr:C25 family cysteine peptidase [Acidobacteriota bacterium]